MLDAEFHLNAASILSCTCRLDVDASNSLDFNFPLFRSGLPAFVEASEYIEQEKKRHLSRSAYLLSEVFGGIFPDF